MPDSKTICCEKFLAFSPQGKYDPKHCPKVPVSNQRTVRCKISLCNLCFYPLLQVTLWLRWTKMQLWLNRVLCPCRHLLRLITGKDSRVLTSAVWVPSQGNYSALVWHRARAADENIKGTVHVKVSQAIFRFGELKKSSCSKFSTSLAGKKLQVFN